MYAALPPGKSLIRLCSPSCHCIEDGRWKMEDGSDLLPIIVLEMPSILLMAAVRNVQIARPAVYQVVQEMVDKIGYEVDNEKECMSFDLQPSDAINISVRCKLLIAYPPYEVQETLTSEQTHNNLKRFEITGFSGSESEVELVLYVLKIATALEILTIDPHRWD